MQRRRRPRQHPRQLQSGKRILVNRGLRNNIPSPEVWNMNKGHYAIVKHEEGTFSGMILNVNEAFWGRKSEPTLNLYRGSSTASFPLSSLKNADISGWAKVRGKEGTTWQGIVASVTFLPNPNYMDIRLDNGEEASVSVGDFEVIG